MPRLLVIVSAVMLVVRVAWVLRFREIDADAYGHFFIAIAARKDPTNINVHWVWLPLYHFAVGALTGVGLTFRGLRLVNAVLAGVAPLLLWDALRKRSDDIALLAATLFAASPLLTILGQSGQPETVFLLFIVLSIRAAAHDWPVRTGLWLAFACMIRYEAWGATLALCIFWLGWQRTRRSLIVVAIPAAVVLLYILFRFHTDGTLLLFFRGTREVQVARGGWTFSSVVDFPIRLPCAFLGPAIIALPFGVKTLTKHERVMAAGLAAFLLLSYYSNGSHSGERYLVSLTPFAWIAIGSFRRPRAQMIMLALVVVTTIWHLQRAARMAIDWNDGLREREAELERKRTS